MVVHFTRKTGLCRRCVSSDGIGDSRHVKYASLKSTFLGHLILFLCLPSTSSRVCCCATLQQRRRRLYSPALQPQPTTPCVARAPWIAPSVFQRGVHNVTRARGASFEDGFTMRIYTKTAYNNTNNNILFMYPIYDGFKYR